MSGLGGGEEGVTRVCCLVGCLWVVSFVHNILWDCYSFVFKGEGAVFFIGGLGVGGGGGGWGCRVCGVGLYRYIRSLVGLVG